MRSKRILVISPSFGFSTNPRTIFAVSIPFVELNEISTLNLVRESTYLRIGT